MSGDCIIVLIALRSENYHHSAKQKLVQSHLSACLNEQWVVIQYSVVDLDREFRRLCRLLFSSTSSHANR